MAYTIRTNHQARDLLALCDLTEKEAADFDYIDANGDQRLVRYLGHVYDVNEFSPLNETQMARNGAPAVFKGWDGYKGDSYSSGVVMRWAKDDAGREDFERVILGTYSG